MSNKPIRDSVASKKGLRHDGSGPSKTPDAPKSINDKLDEFIEATFPASDPTVFSNPVDRVGTPE